MIVARRVRHAWCLVAVAPHGGDGHLTGGRSGKVIIGVIEMYVAEVSVTEMNVAEIDVAERQRELEQQRGERKVRSPSVP